MAFIINANPCFSEVFGVGYPFVQGLCLIPKETEPRGVAWSNGQHKNLSLQES